MRYDANFYTNENFKEKFEILLNERYAQLKKHKRRSTFIKDYDATYNTDIDTSIENTLKQWYSGNQKPSIDKLMNICELLNCDIDYFLTLQECKHHEEQTICDVTLLDEDAAQILTNLSEFESEALNSLIKHPHFKMWLYSLYDFTHSHNIRATTHNAAILLDREKAEEHSYTKNALKYQTTDLLGKILEDLYRENEQSANTQLAAKEFEELMLLIEDIIDNYTNNESEYQKFLSQIKKTINAINEIAGGKVRLYQYPPEFYISNKDIIIKQLRI